MRVSGRNLNKKEDDPFRHSGAPVYPQGYQQPIYIKRNYGRIIIIGVVLCVVFTMMIALIAAIAIPSLLASRKAANEGSALGNLRNLHTAQTTYYATAKNKYGSLEELIEANLADKTAGQPRFTYTYTFTRSANGDRYCMSAISAQPQHRAFGVDNSGVVYVSNQGAITCAGGVLGGAMQRLQ